jgi:hypothetical protein
MILCGQETTLPMAITILFEENVQTLLAGTERLCLRLDNKPVSLVRSPSASRSVSADG